MNDSVRIRLLALVGLTVLGVVLAVAAGGGALGIGETTAANPQVAVSDDNVTVSNGNEKAVVVENMSRIRTIEITTDDGRIDIETTRTDSELTDGDRARAIEIAQSNTTIQRLLDSETAYTFEVQPVKRLRADSAQRFNVSITMNDTDGQQDTFTVDDIKQTENGESVTIRQQATFVEDKASVRIRDPDGELLYSVDVNLDSRRVSGITDWTTE